MNKTYIILPAAKINEIDFAEICETSSNTIRYNLDSSQFIVKFQGNTPEFLDGYDEYTNSEILEISSKSEAEKFVNILNENSDSGWMYEMIEVKK